MPAMNGPLPQVVADLTFTPVRHGLATVPPGIWAQDPDPVAGELVLVSDGGAGPFEAVITEIDPDGTLVLKIRDFVPAHA
jgi:hypothetical protein